MYNKVLPLPLAELTLMLSSESGLVDTTLLLLLKEHDCVILLLWQAVQSALHLKCQESDYLEHSRLRY